MPDMILKTYRAETKAAEDEEAVIEAIVSTTDRDREGEVILPDAFKKGIKTFMKHPILLSSHDYRDLRKQIGKVLKLKAAEDRIEAKLEYFVGEGNEEADWAYNLASKGLAAYSLGFIPKVWEDGDGEKAARRTFTECELLEISQVLVPSNRAALVSLRSKGVSPLVVDMAEKAMELVTKPEETEDYVRIPAPGQEGKHDGHRIRTIDISEKEGIKALYCGEDKVVITYLFAKDHDWTMEKARAWVKEHSKSFEMGNTEPPKISVVQDIDIDQSEGGQKMAEEKVDTTAVIVETAVKKAMEDYLKQVPEGKRFTPGTDDEPKGRVTKDEADQPWGDKGHGLGVMLKAVHRAAITQGRELDPRLLRTKATGLYEAVPSEGGFLIDQEFIPQLMERVWLTGIVAAKCAKQQVGAGFNGVKIPAVNETSRADGYRWGGIRAYWGAESGTKSASRPAFRQISLELQKLYGLCYATDELLEDATALESYIMRWFPLEFGFKLDDSVVNGDGAGKPLGILESPCLVSVAKETGQAAATVVTENIVKMWARLWAPSRANAVWLINQDIEPQLHTMSLAVGTGGIPVYMPPNGLSERPYGVLYSRPVLPIEQCQTLGTVGDIILADMSQYLLIEKGGIKTASSIHVQFTTDETAFRFVYRVNGQPIWNSALTPFKGSNTQSPFVVLATRA